ncbi:sugar ABC transporter substrate-binding protein [Clostridium estertheticum]|uniref:Sugar ABC transporter substrate-binding protein n=1 Tax=Clostridium estertheticum TaxID=238834 RepID=A0AA47EEG1_9CLOT|nr:sugar ABC transporter substrate-binding protein [Clostridium estertheticum]MBU3154849.1 sugar ABC transporter substrate-binding protein [Clostridium estertheticum]MBU3200456.1 sugar ABC transporter substrate-binding protein [Clostridium estertheticum]WAG58678.1 sugar ABC transporter substrate-binding protein [Clostridium estertheticum]WAG67284.1 sugar ABC transporter substrate-binding protein [Clostridium estertheticum]
MTKKTIVMILIILMVLFTGVLSVYLSFIKESPFGGKRLKFGATYMNMNNPYFVKLNESIKKTVESQNGTLIALDAQLEVSKQISQVDDLISQKVDIIFLNAVDFKGIKPALIAAKKANIPVIVVDSPVFDDKLVDCTVVSENYNAGVLCARDLVAKLNGKGNVVIIEHPTAKSAIQRIEGFEDTINKYKGIKVVARKTSNGQLELAMEVMDSIIQSNKKIDAVMCLNDPTALGVIAAFENTKKNDKVYIYGVDGADDALAMIEKGKLTATAAQSPDKIGKIAAETALKKLEGLKIENYINVPVELINKQNLVYP